MQAIYIGTSGWSYPHWISCFYGDVSRNNWLNYYASCFNSVEINASFYRLQSPDTYHHWVEQTPSAFRFCLKANRYLTHTKKLNNPEHSIPIEKQHAQHLQPKLALVLWQLPRTLAKNAEKLQNFINALSQWQEVRHTIEFRHKSWFTTEIAEMFTSNNIASCISDAADWPIWLQATTDFVYIRLHGHSHTYRSKYSTPSLKKWATRIIQWNHDNKEVWVYFDNDATCAAVENAIELQRLLHE